MKVSNGTLTKLKRIYDTFNDNPMKEFKLKEIDEIVNTSRGQTKLKVFLEMLIYLKLIKKINSSKNEIRYKLWKNINYIEITKVYK